ncbi:MAG: alpha/beta hydrolase [Hyphomicrobiaceae bacterium]
MPYVKAQDGTELFYEESGQGQPLVMIHGWPLSTRMWEYQMTVLSGQGIRCIAYDRRGFGRSDHPPQGYDFDTLADDLKALMDALDLHDVTLAGFSMGGGEVARYMSRHRGARVAKAVLISAVTPYLLKTPENVSGVDSTVFEGMLLNLSVDRPEFLTEFSKSFFGSGMLSSPVSASMLSATCEDAMRASPIATMACVKAFSETDFRDDLKSFNVPTLIIHGDNDQTVPIESSGQVTARLMPHAKFEIYSGAPHGLFYTEKDRLNGDLAKFVLTPATFAMPPGVSDMEAERRARRG